MTVPDEKGVPPPPEMSRRLLDHQRWLNSDGRFGKQLVGSELLFDNCDLEGIDLSRADIEYAYFRGGSVKGARFVGTHLFSATFVGCDVEGADFSNANLRWANFLTNHEKACLDGADITRTAWNAEQREQNRKDYPDRGEPRKLWPRDTLKI